MTASRKNKTQNRRLAKGRVRRKAAPMATVTPPAAISAVLPSTGYQMRRQGHNCVVTGHEFLVEAIKVVGQNLCALYDMNPATWVGSRLVNVARSYELYRINKAVLTYVPQVGTTTSGTVSIGFETDPNEPIPATGNFFQRSLANHYSTLGPVWAGCKATYVRPSQETRWWHCSMEESERRQTSQLMAYGVTNSSTTGLGWLMVQYEIEFMYPELENQIGAENFSGDTFVTGNPAVAVDGQVRATFANDTAARLIETVYQGTSNLIEFRSSGQNFDIAPGQAIYWAYSELASAWLAYRTLEAARAGAGAVTKIINSLAANALAGAFRCRVVSRVTTAF